MKYSYLLILPILILFSGISHTTSSIQRANDERTKVRKEIAEWYLRESFDWNDVVRSQPSLMKVFTTLCRPTSLYKMHSYMCRHALTKLNNFYQLTKQEIKNTIGTKQ
jgi:hypothetical protein